MTDEPQIEQTTPLEMEPEVTANWYDTLPEHLKTNPNVTKYSSLEKALEADLERTKLLGKRIKELTPDEVKNFITPDEMISYAQSQGLPASVEDYKLPTIEDHLDKEILAEIKQRAFDHKLTPVQAEELLKYSVEANNKLFQKQRAIWADEVVSTYGKDTEKVLTIANKALDKFGSPEMHKYIRDAGLENHPMLIQMMHNIGIQMMPDGLPGGTTSLNSSSSIQAAREGIQALMGDKDFMARWKRGDANTKALLESKYLELQKLEQRG